MKVKRWITALPSFRHGTLGPVSHAEGGRGERWKRGRDINTLIRIQTPASYVEGRGERYNRREGILAHTNIRKEGVCKRAGTHLYIFTLAVKR